MNGNTIIVPIEIETATNAHRMRIDTNRVKTVYGHDNSRISLDNYIKHSLESGNLTQIYEQKVGRGARLINAADPTNTSISQNGENVNGSARDTLGRALSKQQQEFFKDSKVRDENGNLRPMYHGTDAEFNVFSYDNYGKTGTGYGKGFYFTDSKEAGESYGKNLKEVYLDIKKPIEFGKTTMTKEDYAKFVNEVDKEANGVIETLQKNKGAKVLYDTISEPASTLTTDSNAAALGAIANSNSIVSQNGENVNNIKNEQFEIIKNTNPMLDDYHTGIRSPEDIKTYSEILRNPDTDEEFVYPDWTEKMAKQMMGDGNKKQWVATAFDNFNNPVSKTISDNSIGRTSPVTDANDATINSIVAQKEGNVNLSATGEEYSSFARKTSENGNFSDEVRQALKEDPLTYKPTTNAERVARADEIIGTKSVIAKFTNYVFLE